MVIESKIWSYQLKDSAADSKLKLLKEGEIFGVEKPGGEKRLHIGSINDKKRFDDFFFPNGEDYVLFEVSKIDLIQYILSAAEEYKHPSQNYRLPLEDLHTELLNQTLSIEDNVFFIRFEKNVDSKRYYLSRPKGDEYSKNYSYISKISLPLITTFYFVRNKNEDNTYKYYLKPCFSPDNIDPKESTSKRQRPFSLQQIFYGAPGTGKSYEIDKDTNENNRIRTTFHPDYDYATFVGAYKPAAKQVNKYGLNGGSTVSMEVDGKTIKEDVIVYKFIPQAFIKAYVEAWKRHADAECTDKDFYLVIEEINRGNCAQIFGDLFQLLDRTSEGFSSYAVETESDLQNFLKEDEEYKLGITLTENIKNDDGKVIATKENVMNGKVLVLPPNLHIWATMNTSDQSLFPIDSAFKRRWDWVYKPIKYNNTEWKIVLNNEEVCKWTELQQTLNNLIYEATDSEDKMLGDWFVKADSMNEINEDKLVGKIIFYLWNDVAKVDAGKLFDLEIEKNGTKRKVVFSDFYNIDGKVNTDVVRAWLKDITVLKTENAEDKTPNEPEQ